MPTFHFIRPLHTRHRHGKFYKPSVNLQTYTTKLPGSTAAFFFCGTTAQIGPRPPRFHVSRSLILTHTHTHTPRQHFSKRIIIPSQRPTQQTTNTRHKHPCPQRDSNPRSCQSSGCRHKPYTARPPGSATEAIGSSEASVPAICYSSDICHFYRKTERTGVRQTTRELSKLTMKLEVKLLVLINY